MVEFLGNPSWLDVKQSLDANGQQAVLVDIVAETNEIINDITFFEGNDITGHTVATLTGYPSSTFTKMYQRVQPDKATRTQVRETACMQEAYGEIDERLYNLNGQGAAFMMNEAMATMKAMNIGFVEKLFYGNGVAKPEEIMGLANRYSSLSSPNGKRNILNAGGTGSDNRSIWLIAWSPTSLFCFTPKGLPSGLQFKNLGVETSERNDGLMRVIRQHFSWTFGLGIWDWKGAVRIANIDFSNLNADISGTSANLPQLMKRAIRRIPKDIRVGARVAFYMSADVQEKLEEQLASEVKQSTLTTEDVGGVQVDMFRKIPLRQVDQLEVNEARVV